MYKKTLEETQKKNLQLKDTPTWDRRAQKVHDFEELKQATDAFHRAVTKVRQQTTSIKSKTTKRYKRYMFYNEVIKQVERLCTDIDNQANVSVRLDTDDADLQKEFEAVAIGSIQELDRTKAKIKKLGRRTSASDEESV